MPYSATNIQAVQQWHDLQSSRETEFRIHVQALQKYGLAQHKLRGIPSYQRPMMSESLCTRIKIPCTVTGAIELVSNLMEAPGANIHPTDVAEILVQSTAVFRPSHRITYVDAPIDKKRNVVIVGDLRGQLADLFTIFAKFGTPSPEHSTYVFNGNLTGGKHSVEVLMIVLMFKLVYPDNVHINRGCMEDPATAAFFGFEDEIKAKCPGCIDLFMDLFHQLPLATVIDHKMIVLHSGLPREDDIKVEHLQHVPKYRDIPAKPMDPHQRRTHDILWSDPAEWGGRSYGHRGPDSMLFGPDVTARFLENNDLAMMVRSREVPQDLKGTEWHHEDRIVTVFSASNLAGCGGNEGSVLELTHGGQLVEFAYVAAPLSHFQEFGIETKLSKAESAELLRGAVTEAQRANERIAWDRIMSKKNELTDYLTVHGPLDKVYREKLVAGLVTVVDRGFPWDSVLTAFGVGLHDREIVCSTFLGHFQIEMKTNIFSDWEKEVKGPLAEILINGNLPFKEICFWSGATISGLLSPEALFETLVTMDLGLDDDTLEVLITSLPRNSNGLIDPTVLLLGLSDQDTLATACPGTLRHLSVLGDHLTYIYPWKELVSILQAAGRADGTLTIGEFIAVLGRILPGPIAPSPAIAMKIAEAIDIYRTGCVDIIEFLDALHYGKGSLMTSGMGNKLGMAIYNHKFMARRALERLSTDGKCSAESMVHFLDSLSTMITDSGETSTLSEGTCLAIVAALNVDEDGLIDTEEFLSAFQAKPMPKNLVKTKKPPIGVGSFRGLPVASETGSIAGSIAGDMPLLTSGAQSFRGWVVRGVVKESSDMATPRIDIEVGQLEEEGQVFGKVPMPVSFRTLRRNRTAQ